MFFLYSISNYLEVKSIVNNNVSDMIPSPTNQNITDYGESYRTH